MSGALEAMTARVGATERALLRQRESRKLAHELSSQQQEVTPKLARDMAHQHQQDITKLERELARQQQEDTRTLTRQQQEEITKLARELVRRWQEIAKLVQEPAGQPQLDIAKPARETARQHRQRWMLHASGAWSRCKAAVTRRWTSLREFFSRVADGFPRVVFVIAIVFSPKISIAIGVCALSLVVR
jgi:predicted methyltransferase